MEVLALIVFGSCDEGKTDVAQGFDLQLDKAHKGAVPRTQPRVVLRMSAVVVKNSWIRLAGAR